MGLEEEEAVEVQKMSGEEKKKRRKGMEKQSRRILPLRRMEVKSVSSNARERKTGQEESRSELEM